MSRISKISILFIIVVLSFNSFGQYAPELTETKITKMNVEYTEQYGYLFSKAIFPKVEKVIKAVKVNQLNQADKIHRFISDFLNETFYETENLNIEVTLSVSVLDTRTHKINSFGNYPISYLVCLPNHAYTLKKELETIDQTENFQLFIPPGSNFYIIAGIDFHNIDNTAIKKAFIHLETIFRTIFHLPFKNQIDILIKDLAEVRNEFSHIETLTIFGLQFEKIDAIDINENV